MNMPTSLPKTLLILCLLTGLAFAEAAGQEAGPYEMSLDLEEGATYTVTVENRQNINQQIQGQSIDMTQQQTFTYRYDVTEVADDGTMTVEATYERVAAEAESMGGSFSYDSADADTSAAASPQVHMLATLVGRQFTFRVRPTGEVFEVQGIGEMIDAMLAAMEAPNEQARAQMEEQLRSQFDEEALHSQIERSFAFYPEDPVQVGESWTAQYTLEQMVPLWVGATYTLESVEDGIATVSVNSNANAVSDAEPMRMGQAEVDLDLNGTQTGTLRIDLSTGLPVEMQLTQDFSGDGEVFIGAEMTEMRTIPLTLTIDGTMTMTTAPAQ